MFLKKKLKGSLLIILLILCATGCGAKDYSLHYADKMVLDFGSNDSPLTLIKKIGKTKVTKNMIKKNRIELGNFYVECNAVDTHKVGSYSVKYIANDTEKRMQTFTVNVQDISPPVIKLKKKSLTMTMEEYKKFDFSTVMEISDNWKDDDFTVDLKVKAIEGNGKYTVNITAKDIAGNTSKNKIALTIKDKEKPKEENKEKGDTPKPETPQIVQPVNPYPQETPIPAPTPEPAPTPTPAPVEPEVTPPVVTTPSTQDFLFSDGYTMENVGNACQSALSSSGQSGSCSPITDNSGIYLGMRLSLY